MMSLRNYYDALPRIFALLLLCAFLSACSMFSDDKDEDDPAELVKLKSSLRIKKAWSRRIGDETEFLRLALTVSSDGSMVYAGAHDGRVAAFSATKGKRKWLTKTRIPLSAGPAVGSGIVVAGSNDGDVVALDARDGKELWRIKVSSEVLASPAVSDELALVRTVDGKLTALRLQDGSEAWFVQQSVPRLTVRGTGSPVVLGDVVLCGFDNGRLAAYELVDGSQIWDELVSPPEGRTEIDRLSDINATVKVVGDDIYVAGYQNDLVALAIESGQTLWTRELSSDTGIGVDTTNVYVTLENGLVTALTRRGGRELWRQDALYKRDLTGPTPFGRSVVVGDFEGYLHWMDIETGEFQARVRAGSARITSQPLVVNDTLYVVNDDGKLYAFRDRTRRDKR